MSDVTQFLPEKYYQFHLTIYSHYFKLSGVTQRARIVIEKFAMQFVKYGVKKEWNQHIGKVITSRVAENIFAASTIDRREYRFHINCLSDFREALTVAMFDAHLYKETVVLPKPGVPVKLKAANTWKLRDNQIPLYEYLISDGLPIAKFLGAATGFGKTSVSALSIAKIGVRTVVIVRPMYMKKWVQDFKDILNLKKKEIMTIAGGDQVKDLINLCLENKLEAKVIIISNKTFQGYITAYEDCRTDFKETGYNCNPDELFGLMGAGLRLIDEVHQDFHLQAKIDFYTSIPRSISLSATLIHDDPFISKMHNLMHPVEWRCPVPEPKKYINAISYLYHIQPHRKFRTSFQGNNYSHVAYELSILKDKTFKHNYFDFIRSLVEESYFKLKKVEQKAAIYFATTDMCTAFVEYLKDHYPNEDIRRYAPSLNDPYKDLLEAAIRVATVGGAGTAHDIKGLISVILTISLSSIQANIQVLGRLREIPDQRVLFYYLASLDIPKHMQYNEEKLKLLSQRAASVQTRIAYRPL